jgi:isocitrate/isopropylmalate dehydrogenase
MTKLHLIVTLVAGSGIGLEIAAVFVKVLEAAEVSITWDACTSPSSNLGAFHTIVESAQKYRLLTKGVLETPMTRGWVRPESFSMS